jgi:hypothetical protein
MAWLTALAAGLLWWSGPATAQVPEQRLIKHGATVCRNKADIERLLDYIVKRPVNVEASMQLTKKLTDTGACVSLPPCTWVIVLETAKYPPSRNLYIARIRQAGADGEHYVSSAAFLSFFEGRFGNPCAKQP